MEDKPKDVLKIEREMKRLVARMNAESNALNKILKVLEPRIEETDPIPPDDKDKKKRKNNPNK